MSDLRDCIAAAVDDALFTKGAYTEYGPDDDEPGDWQRVDGHINLTALADAVIVALGMQEERDRPYSVRTGWKGDWRHRYVTDWENDE